MRSNTNSISGTPRQRKTLSAKSNIDTGNAFSHEVDLHKVDIKKSYHTGSFNTKTNNSGPDNTRPTWMSNNYDLSADEDQVPNTASDSVDQAETFVANNAKVKRIKSSVSNQWFQKNMFGLPNDESDDVLPEFSGAISGDEQCDSKAFQKPKTSILKLKKTSKSMTTSRRWDSSVAVPSSPWWYLMSFFLPAALINSCIYCSVYLVDRIFGTSYTLKWMTTTNQARRPSGTRISSKMLWLLLPVAILSLLMYLLLDNRESRISYSLRRVTKSVCNVIGKDCSELDNNWAFGRQLAFCLFSLTASLVMASLHQMSRNKEESLMIKTISPFIGKSIPVTLSRVVDGDTVYVVPKDSKNSSIIKVRMTGIDSPEMKQAFGPEAKNHLETIFINLSMGTFTLFIKGIDIYQRCLGVIFSGSFDVNKLCQFWQLTSNSSNCWKMVDDGYAWCYRHTQCPKLYQEAMKKAQENRKGLFVQKDPIPPWEWRKQQKN